MTSKNANKSEDGSSGELMVKREPETHTPRVRTIKSQSIKQNQHTISLPMIHSEIDSKNDNRDNHGFDDIPSRPKSMKAANDEATPAMEHSLDPRRTEQHHTEGANNELLRMPSGGPISGNASMHNDPHGHMSADEHSLVDDNDVEMPSIEEIEEARPRKALKRTTFKSRKMMGNTKYRFKDRIWPRNFCFTIFTAFMIIIPSIMAITVV